MTDTNTSQNIELSSWDTPYADYFTSIFSFLYNFMMDPTCNKTAAITFTKLHFIYNFW
jgi:hypothetical protein